MINEHKDLKQAILFAGIVTLIGFFLLGQYYKDLKLATAALTIIVGVEFWNLAREYRSRKS